LQVPYDLCYDDFGDLQKVSAGNNEVVSKDTDYAGNTQTTTFNGFAMTTRVDDYGRATKVLHNGAEKYSATYDNFATSNLKSAIDYTTGLNYTYTYSKDGQLSSKIVTKNGANHYSVAYTQDDFGNVDTEIITVHDGTNNVSITHHDNTNKATGRLLDQTATANGKVYTTSFVYDKLGRPSGITTTNGSTAIAHNIQYLKKIYLDKDFDDPTNNVYSTRETNLPKREVSLVGDVATIFDYAYNDKGQLISAFANGKEVSYKYDQYDRLIEEINRPLARRYVYVYDDGGNITSRSTYKYNKANSADNGLISTDLYAYGNVNWKDQLTSYKGVSIAYDTVGNPLSHNGNALSWTRGRLLASYGANTYTYNVNGIRTSKTVSGITKDYILDGDRLLAEKWSNGTNIYYVYNANGIAGFVYNGIPYVYQKNVFGDIVAIYNHAGGKVAGYRYNAYGECYIYNPQLDANSNGATIAEINPFRYRGYYYDSETGLYYLQSRYYDPAMGRFINADIINYISPLDINGNNLYSYCFNNPIAYYDPTGHFPWLLFLLGAAVGFGATAYADYKDDGEVFNGSISAESYAANSLVTGTIFALAGAFATKTFTFTLPNFGITMTSSGAATVSTAAVVTVTGAQVLGLVGVLGAGYLFAKGGLPNNKYQNQQWAEAMRQLGIKDKDLWQRLHKEMGRHPYYTHDNLKKLISLLEEILKKWGKL